MKLISYNVLCHNQELDGIFAVIYYGKIYEKLSSG